MQKTISEPLLDFRDPTTAHMALHTAASQGDLVMVQCLYQQGLSLSVHDDSYCLPIHYAAYDNQSAVIKWLIEQSPQMANDRADYGMTPLHMAASNGAVEAMITLLHNGAQHDARNHGSQTAVNILLHEYPQHAKLFDNNDYTLQGILNALNKI